MKVLIGFSIPSLDIYKNAGDEISVKGMDKDLVKRLVNSGKISAPKTTKKKVSKK